MKKIITHYDPILLSQVATLMPEHGGIEITVIPLRFMHLNWLDELWLYCFDADGNCIEFPFGVREGKIEELMEVVFKTNAAIHRPPFEIQIRHQVETERIELYKFLIFYEEV